MHQNDSSHTPARLSPQGCLSLIGMAGAGKSTLGRIVAERLGWAHIDTDRLLEAYYGMPLQTLLDGLGLTDFLAVENKLVSMLGVRRAVISTGGSVVYGAEAMERLRLLGPVVYLEIGLEDFLRRVTPDDNRGLAIAPGRSLADLFAERQPLYSAAADFTVRTDRHGHKESLEQLMAWLEENPE
jgi:shikimate kinase